MASTDAPPATTLSTSSPPTAAAAPSPSPAPESKSSGKSSPKSAGSPRNPGDEAMDPLSGEHWTQQPVESDSDSVLDSILSSTASLSSSIFEYRNINGRTFHSDKTNAEYWGPNDDKQLQSQDIIHHVLTLVLQGELYLAPIDPGRISKVLDVGTGGGLWAIDFADLHPNTEVTGTDISPVQPSWVPPNVRFEIEDATQPWTFRENSFDFVHMRYLFGSIADWDGLFAQAYAATKPGGWIESFEADANLYSEDGTVTEDSPMGTWTKVFKEAKKKFGRTFFPIEEDVQRQGIEKAGFVNVTVKDFKVPMTGFPKDPKLKEIGQYSHLSIEQDLEGMVLYIFGEVMGWSVVEIHAFLAHFRKQMRDKSCHPLFPVRIVYAQKPEKGKE
ncbi:S-adenosyl-L-methionine-dependent methyltransferase [Apiosordaria backusii]|uniref:S-adenosyl-L-methionine-dependent methyltransferase n=1 Tax=Apiosordaria backusii TaxID=314023 RepID=A0AA40A7B7_9PEZI|nr:S-adenosyl-L-methionine-dependent methyltransferase [Apiosordaria backusii]